MYIGVSYEYDVKKYLKSCNTDRLLKIQGDIEQLLGDRLWGIKPAKKAAKKHHNTNKNTKLA